MILTKTETTRDTFETVFARNANAVASQFRRMAAAATRACRAGDALATANAAAVDGLKAGDVLGKSFDEWKPADEEMRAARDEWEAERKAFRELMAEHEHALDHVSARFAEWGSEPEDTEGENDTPAHGLRVVPREDDPQGTAEDPLLVRLETGRITAQEAAALLGKPVHVIEQMQRVRAYGWGGLLHAVETGEISLDAADVMIERAIVKGRAAELVEPRAVS